MGRQKQPHRRAKGKRIKELEQQVASQTEELNSANQEVEYLHEEIDMCHKRLNTRNVRINKMYDKLAKSATKIMNLETEASKREATRIHDLICVGGIMFMLGAVAGIISIFVGMA